MLLSRQAGGDSAATLYPLSLAPSPTPSCPPPSSRASFPLALPPLHPKSYTPEALEQSRPTLGNRYSHHHSLPLCLYLSIPRSMSPWPACSDNKWRARLSVGEEDTGKGRLVRGQWRKQSRGHCTSSILLQTSPSLFLYSFTISSFSHLLSSSLTLSHSPRIKVSLSEWGIFSCASRTLPTLALFLSFPLLFHGLDNPGCDRWGVKTFNSRFWCHPTACFIYRTYSKDITFVCVVKGRWHVSETKWVEPLFNQCSLLLILCFPINIISPHKKRQLGYGILQCVWLFWCVFMSANASGVHVRVHVGARACLRQQFRAAQSMLGSLSLQIRLGEITQVHRGENPPSPIISVSISLCLSSPLLHSFPTLGFYCTLPECSFMVKHS